MADTLQHGLAEVIHAAKVYEISLHQIHSRSSGSSALRRRPKSYGAANGVFPCVHPNTVRKTDGLHRERLRVAVRGA